MNAKPMLVRLTSGETLEVCGQTDHGVDTDAGRHPWSECLAFIVWSETHKRAFTIPLKGDA